MCTTYGEDDASNRIVVCNEETFGNLEDCKCVCRSFSEDKGEKLSEDALGSCLKGDRR